VPQLIEWTPEPTSDFGPAFETAKLCGDQYDRPGGRLREDRIVRCSLPVGHDGPDHREIDTGSTWPVAALPKK
jgi:hypothetical protein